MSCGCLGVLYKPHYKRRVDAIYPPNPSDEKLVSGEMDKLTYYTLQHPEKLDRIGNYLYNILTDGLAKQQHGWVKVSIDAIVELLKPCHAQRINLFISSYLKMCIELLDNGNNAFRLLGTNAFVQFSEKEESGTVQDHDFSHLIKIFCSLCQHKAKSSDETEQIRCCGIRGLQGVLRKSLEQKQRDELIKKYADIIIPALLFNLQDNIEADNTSKDSIDDESPRGLSDQVLRDLLSRITMDQIRLVIHPLLTHLDNANLWPSENAISWAQLFMRSVRESYSHLIIKLVLAHVRSKDAVKQSAEIEGLLNVVSQVSSIPDINTLGTIANELFMLIVSLVVEIKSERLRGQFVATCGTIISNVQNYIQLEVLESMLTHVDQTNQNEQKLILLQIMAHCATFYVALSSNDFTIMNFVKSLLEMDHRCGPDGALLVARILVKVLDNHANVTSLSQNGSWSVPASLTLATSTSASLRKQSRPLIQWLYDQLRLADNQTANFLVYYQLAGVLLAEINDRSDHTVRAELIQQMVKVILAIQDVNRIDELFEDAVKCQTHAVLGAMLNLIASNGLDAISTHVLQVTNERKHDKPQLAPDSLFSGSTDALRRSTASLYSRNDETQTDNDKLFFNRQVMCEQLRLAGIDVTGLTEPLGADFDVRVAERNDSIGKEVSADDISIKFSLVTAPSLDLAKLGVKNKSHSFTDLLNSYKAVPQTLDELNKQNARQVAEFKKREFHQVVSTLEADHRAQREIFDKLITYSSHLQDSGVFVDHQQDDEYHRQSLLFCD